MMRHTHKQEFETTDQYLIRLGNNKDILNLDWNGICQLMNATVDEEYSESKWRKEYHVLKRGFDLAVKSQSTDSKVLSELEQQTLEFEKEKVKVQDQRRLYSDLIRKQARFDHLKDEIHSAILDFEKQKPLTFIRKNKASGQGVKANVLFSDWHVGSEFSNSVNAYNLDIFKERLNTLILSIIEYSSKEKVTDLTIGALGDFISGAIHVSTRVQSNENVIRQIQIVAEYLSESIAELSKHFNSIHVINIVGNHARLIADKHQSIMNENLEKIIPWYLNSRLREFKNVTISQDQDGYFVDEVDGEFHVYIHGDLDHVSSVAKTLPQVLGVVPKFIFCGHIHHDTVKEFGYTKVISNGSMIGTDDYAISKRFHAEPMQKMHIFDTVGRIENTKYIYL